MVRKEKRSEQKRKLFTHSKQLLVVPDGVGSGACTVVDEGVPIPFQSSVGLTQ